MFSLKELALHELMLRYHGPLKVLNQFHKPEAPHQIDWDGLLEETAMEVSFEVGDLAPNINQEFMLNYLLCQYYDVQPLLVRQTALADNAQMAGQLDKYVISVPDHGYLEHIPTSMAPCDSFTQALEVAMQSLNLLYVFSTETALGLEWYSNEYPDFLNQVTLPKF